MSLFLLSQCSLARPQPRWRRAFAALGVSVLGALAVGATHMEVAGAYSLTELRTPRKPARFPGYQLATTAGDVLPFGAAASEDGPAGGLPSPVTGVARTPTGNGAWLVTADGGVRTSGDAPFLGSVAGIAHTGRATAIAATRSGGGYWVVTSDGGVFAFGDAPFLGSATGIALNASIVAVVPTPTDSGYWLASSDGGVYAFGDAPFLGARADAAMPAWVTGMASMPSGAGYWLVSIDGGVFAFGDAPFLGRPDSDVLHSAVVGIAPTRSGQGYWLATTDGAVYAYGDAPFLGAANGKVWGEVVGITAGAGRKVQREAQAVPAHLRSAVGNDVSWPQCETSVPSPGHGFGIVGLTGGRPFTANPCVAAEWAWATTAGSGGGVYVNLAAAVPGGPAEMHGPAGDCKVTDLPCQTYNQAANTIGAALAVARANGVTAPMWWLDVEVMNHWSANTALNTLTVKAAAETLAHSGIRAGVYSTPLMWRTITDGARMDLPVWVAGGTDDAGAPALCSQPRADFTGGGVLLVQSLPVVFDTNVACAPTVAAPTSVFHFSG